MYIGSPALAKNALAAQDMVRNRVCEKQQLSKAEISHLRALARSLSRNSRVFMEDKKNIFFSPRRNTDNKHYHNCTKTQDHPW